MRCGLASLNINTLVFVYLCFVYLSCDDDEEDEVF